MVVVAHVSFFFFFAAANLNGCCCCCCCVDYYLVIRKPITFVVLRTWSRRAVICRIRAARRGGLNGCSWRKGEKVKQKKVKRMRKSNEQANRLSALEECLAVTVTVIIINVVMADLD